MFSKAFNWLFKRGEKEQDAILRDQAHADAHIYPGYYPGSETWAPTLYPGFMKDFIEAGPSVDPNSDDGWGE